MPPVGEIHRELPLIIYKMVNGRQIIVYLVIRSLFNLLTANLLINCQRKIDTAVNIYYIHIYTMWLFLTCLCINTETQ
jgi:hypothetical protein